MDFMLHFLSQFFREVLVVAVVVFDSDELFLCLFCCFICEVVGIIVGFVCGWFIGGENIALTLSPPLF